MFNRKSIIVLATALSFGAAAFTVSAPANAASAMNFGGLEQSVDGNVTTVGKKGGHNGHRRRHHGHRGHRHHRRHFGGHWGYPGYFGGCYFKTFKRWDPYSGDWVFYRKQFCY